MIGLGTSIVSLKLSQYSNGMLGRLIFSSSKIDLIQVISTDATARALYSASLLDLAITFAWKTSKISVNLLRK